MCVYLYIYIYIYLRMRVIYNSYLPYIPGCLLVKNQLTYRVGALVVGLKLYFPAVFLVRQSLQVPSGPLRLHQSHHNMGII